MRLSTLLRAPLTGTLAIVALFLALMYGQMQPERWVDLIVRGLTLGMLYFLVASGLSLIFGLMDVLNFAHGSLFMIGAYGAWSFYSVPLLLTTVVPLLMAGAGGCLLALYLLAVRPSLIPFARNGTSASSYLTWLLGIPLLLLLYLGVRDLDLSGLATLSPLPAQVLPGAVGDKAGSSLSLSMRSLLFSGAGLILGLMLSTRRPARREQMGWRWPAGAVLIGLALMLAVYAEPAAELLLGMGSNLRFVFALIVGTALGGLAGAAIESTLIRPLYERPLYQVLLTLGLTFVLTQGARALFGPGGYQMEKPSFFDSPMDGRSCTSDSILTFLSENCVRVEILGAVVPSYRLFIIFLGVLLLVSVGLLLQRSRLGIIIRAGVENSEMVEALGINVRRIFTLVFSLGAGIAALGGAAAAPLLRVDPDIGLTYQLQAFVVVVLGGMGSFGGAAIGALIVGLAEAFSTYLVTSFRISTSIATASSVIIMGIVLLVRPSGLFGKRE